MRNIFYLAISVMLISACGTGRNIPKNETDYYNLGYVKVDKDTSTESVSSLKVPMASGYNNIYDYLKGRVAGLDVQGTSITIRGIKSINLSSEPLILVDGVTVSDISWLTPDMVYSIDVLKDASSTALYGSRGANGVILITTRKTND